VHFITFIVDIRTEFVFLLSSILWVVTCHIVDVIHVERISRSLYLLRNTRFGPPVKTIEIEPYGTRTCKLKEQ
jgi:hypothetical protein